MVYFPNFFKSLWQEKLDVKCVKMWENLSVDISLALIIDKKIKELVLLSDILGLKPQHLNVIIFCISVWCF